MFCRHCGRKLAEGSKFCNNCGKDVAGSRLVVAVVITVIVAAAILLWIMSSVASYAPTGQYNSNQSSTSAKISPSITPPQETTPANSTAKSLPEIIAEWGKSTAYVDCYWMQSTYSAYPEGGNPMGNYEQTFLHKSGSGLLALLNSEPTIITNKHVVDDSQYGLATQCDVGFHDDNGAYYSVFTVDQPAQSFTYSPGLAPMTTPEIPQHGKILFDGGGNDVAYLSQMKEFGTPSISLDERAVSGHFTCNSTPIGESLVVLGYPDYGSGAGTINSALSNLQITATEGIISGQDGIYYTTSAKIDPGNSGGLAVDETNDCYIGIPTAVVVGEAASLGRILPASIFLR